MSYDVLEIANAGARSIHQLNFVTNNLANSATPGFKAEHIFYHVLKEAAVNERNEADSPSSVNYNYHPVDGVQFIDFSQGVLSKTGNSLDVAIEGEGFFSIQQKSGTTSYTRNGSFNISRNNELVTSSGFTVLGESGPIRISGNAVEIDGDGTVRVDGNTAGKLKIVAFKNPNKLTRTGDGQYIDDGSAQAAAAEKCRVASGYLESSNVNPIKEMIQMIDIQRYDFETYQKVIQTLTDMDRIATNRIGKLI